MSSAIPKKMPTQKKIAEHLDMSERNVRDILPALAKRLGHDPDDDWWKRASIDKIRVAYVRDLREKAAGRGGDDQVSLAKARTEESQLKTAMMRLDYHRDLKTIVHAGQAAELINDWSRLANREYTQGIHQLVSEIQSAHGITVSQETVEDIAGSTTERIQEHAAKLGRSLDAGGDSVLDTKDAANS